jgi:hypothetical protein
MKTTNFAICPPLCCGAVLEAYIFSAYLLPKMRENKNISGFFKIIHLVRYKSLNASNVISDTVWSLFTSFQVVTSVLFVNNDRTWSDIQVGQKHVENFIITNFILTNVSSSRSLYKYLQYSYYTLTLSLLNNDYFGHYNMISLIVYCLKWFPEVSLLTPENGSSPPFLHRHNE